LDKQNKYYISGISLEGIRCFNNAKIRIPGEQNENSLLIIGKNGTCKSTLLRSIVIGLCDKSDSNALLAEEIGNFVPDNKNEGVIRIELTEIQQKIKFQITTKIHKEKGKELAEKEVDRDLLLRNSNIYYNFEKDLLLCAYGIGRSAYGGSDSGRKYRMVDSAYSLFQYEHSLADPELTLRRLQDFIGENKYNAALSGIKKALGLAPKDIIRIKKGGGVEICGPSTGNDCIPISGWADGYRMTLNWILDLYSWAMRSDRVTKDGGICGIVLIDELEQHLHPSMQASLLPHLNRLFPELQIIATTHSPLVALGSSSENIVVLQKKKKYVSTQNNIPDFSNYSAEDMLTDESLFNSGAYSESINELLSQYNKLLKKSTRSDSDNSRLNMLARKLEVLHESDDNLDNYLKQLRNKFDL